MLTTSPLANFTVILHRPRFPENIGMAARACANMGCQKLILVRPEHWDLLKAEPLATGQAMQILNNIQVYDNLAAALAPFQFSIATSARTGGWRRKFSTPQHCAEITAPLAKSGQKIALVFGPEDRGLNNADICLCDLICNIPTSADATSLNLAQAVLIMLYECHKQTKATHQSAKLTSTRITQGEQMRLEEAFKTVLLNLDCLHGQNPDYFFQQWQGILRRANLQRHEYDALMGFCRQLGRFLD